MDSASKLTGSSGPVGLQLQWAGLQEEDELQTPGYGRAQQIELGLSYMLDNVGSHAAEQI